MRTVVDLNRCQGYARCVPFASDVLKPLGEEALSYDPTPMIRSANEYCAVASPPGAGDRGRVTIRQRAAAI
jgi:hypothetical protein